MQIADPQVRAATLQHLERARGDAGRLPPGTLVRVADIMNSSPEGERVALRMLTALSADVSDRVRQIGEGPELTSALSAALNNGIPAARAAQARVTGDGRYSSVLDRDLALIRKLAAVRMASGESASAAVAAATADVSTGLASLNDSALGHVYFPARQATLPQVRGGLTALKERAISAVPIDAAAGGEAAAAARARRDAARTAVWINEGDRFSLVSRNAAGSVAVLATATLGQVITASQRAVDQTEAVPPPVAAERALEQQRRIQRQGERVTPNDMPVMR
jgi:hypothetical protein